MRILPTILGAILLIVMVTNAKASILGKHLTFDGVPDIIVDDSRADVFDADGSGASTPFDPTDDFSVGDVIFGFISISDFSDTAIGLDQIAIPFAAEILAPIAPNPAAPIGGWDLGPSTVAGHTLSSMLPASLAPKVGPGAPAAALPADAVAVVVSNPGTEDPLLPEMLDAPFPLFASGKWSYEMTLGIDPGLDGTPRTGDEVDFFHFATTGFAGILGAESAGLTVFDHPFGAATVFLPLSAPRLDGGPNTLHDVRLLDGTVFSTGTANWDFTDNSNAMINATPEPASLLVWGILLASGVALVGSYRRRRR